MAYLIHAPSRQQLARPGIPQVAVVAMNEILE